MYIKINDDRYPSNEAAEVMEYFPEEKEMHISERDKYIYLESNIHIGYFIKKFKEFIKVETVNAEGKITKISAVIPKEEVVITRSPNRKHLKKKQG